MNRSVTLYIGLLGALCFLLYGIVNLYVHAIADDFINYEDGVQLLAMQLLQYEPTLLIAAFTFKAVFFFRLFRLMGRYPRDGFAVFLRGPLESTYGVLLKVAGWAIVVLGFAVAIKQGSSSSFMPAIGNIKLIAVLVIFAASTICGLLFMGFGRVIELLEKKQEAGSHPSPPTA